MKEGLPDFYRHVMERYPEVWKAYDGLGRALMEAGRLDRKTAEIVRLALAVASGSEGAVHSHTRRAREAGFSDDELRQTALLAVTAIGWPRAVAALSWIEDILKGG